MILKTGKNALLRHVWQGVVQYAIPMKVVSDQPDRTLLYIQEGTRCKWTFVDFDTGCVPKPVDKIWTDTNVLQIIEKDAAHATWAMWLPDFSKFLGWYINLQATAIRVEDGFLSWDQSLDIVVSPAFKWSWKDEDHFERIQELGWLSPKEAKEVRAEGEGVIRRVEQNRAPFNEPWPQWRPDPDWQIPSLPDNWSEIPDCPY